MTGVPETGQSAESAPWSVESYCENKDPVTAGQGILTRADIYT